jgi:solute carrier family 66, member 2
VTSVAAVTGAITLQLGEDRTYQTFLGLLSSGVEAMLGAPQFLLNYQRQNTSGLSIVLILIWLTGDLYKLSYYMGNHSPVALQACASFQILTDLMILGQFAVYRKNGAEVKKEYEAPTRKVSESTAETTISD